jgi:hypothetical protein
MWFCGKNQIVPTHDIYALNLRFKSNTFAGHKSLLTTTKPGFFVGFFTNFNCIFNHIRHGTKMVLVKTNQSFFTQI